MPHNSVFYVTDVCIPNVWRTVETGVNDKIYISTGLSNPLSVLGPNSIIWHDETITLQPGYYSEADFATALQTALQTTHPFTVSFNTQLKTLTIRLYTVAGLCWRIYTDYEVQTLQGISDPQSINEIIQNIRQTSDIKRNGDTIAVPRIILHPINNVYITSPNLGNFDTLATFSNNVIKKVPVLSDYGTLIVDQFVAPSDFLSCSGQSLKILEFHFRDGRGNYIELFGNHVTFSIAFHIMRI